jgi:hypothetical protein
MVNKMYHSCTIKIMRLHALLTRQTVKCSYHFQYQQSTLLALFLALHCVALCWLFVVELLCLCLQVLWQCQCLHVDPLSVQLSLVKM